MWLAIGIAHFLGTLFGMVVGLPIVTAAAYLILSRLASRPLSPAVLSERPGNSADGDPRTPVIRHATVQQPPPPCGEPLETAVADFGDGDVVLRLVSETYDQQQKRKAKQTEEQNQQMLRQILDENFALWTEISACRRVG